jgi:hypothetical protein
MNDAKQSSKPFFTLVLHDQRYIDQAVFIDRHPIKFKPKATAKSRSKQNGQRREQQCAPRNSSLLPARKLAVRIRGWKRRRATDSCSLKNQKSLYTINVKQLGASIPKHVAKRHAWVTCNSATSACIRVTSLSHDAIAGQQRS